jgi:hypothetical protein
LICYNNPDHKYQNDGVDRILVFMGQMTSLWVISPTRFYVLRGGPGRCQRFFDFILKSVIESGRKREKGFSTQKGKVLPF